MPARWIGDRPMTAAERQRRSRSERALRAALKPAPRPEPKPQPDAGTALPPQGYYPRPATARPVAPLPAGELQPPQGYTMRVADYARSYATSAPTGAGEQARRLVQVERDLAELRATVASFGKAVLSLGEDVTKLIAMVGKLAGVDPAR